MTTWSSADPGAGDLSGVMQRMATLAGVRDHAGAMHFAVSRNMAAMPDEWSGVAASEWQSETLVTATAWQSLHEWASAEYTALSRYAAAVESIASRASRQQSLLLEATAALSAGDASGADDLGGDPALVIADHAALLDESHAASRALAGLAAERQQADDDIARAVQLMRAEAGMILDGWSAPVSGAVRYRDAGASEILGLLSGFSPADLRLLADDASLAARLQRLDPAEVARWWGALSPDVQERLIADSPELIGNLDGVAYGARDLANRKTLANRIAELTAEKKRREADGGVVFARDGRVLPSARLNAIDAQLKALRAVASTLSATGTAPRQLITLEDLESRPRASVCVGDLDTAQHVTYLVPGMGTTVAGDMVSWTTTAQRLQLEQEQVLHRDGIRRNLATVAWIGYAPPGADDVAGVLGEELARKGGDHLADDMEGLAAVRGWTGPKVPTAVVGHSYGTPTAAYALQRAMAGSFVMLGSAGLPLSIRQASDLHVPRGKVTASLSDKDGWAPIGQILGGRRDPTAEGFGGEEFSSDEISVDGEVLHGVTQHGPVVHESNGDGYSYLDANTASIRNTALASLGMRTLNAN